MRSEILSSINYISKNEMHDARDFKEIMDEKSLLTSSGIDSFDFVMLYIKIGDYYGIKDSVFKESLPTGDIPVEVLIDFISEYSTSQKSFNEVRDLYDAAS